MEIPSGKYCSNCPLCQYDADDCKHYCNHLDFDATILEDEFSVSSSESPALRCNECLAVYPGGANIKVKAKPAKKPKEEANGMSKSDWWHRQNDSYPN